MIRHSDGGVTVAAADDGRVRAGRFHPVIRDLRPDDLARALEINQANVPEVGSVDADRLAWIARMSPIALVAEDDLGDGTEVLGFCLVLADDAEYDSVNYAWFVERFEDFMYLDRVAVDAAARGRGLGTARRRNQPRSANRAPVQRASARSAS